MALELKAKWKDPEGFPLLCPLYAHVTLYIECLAGVILAPPVIVCESIDK